VIDVRYALIASKFRVASNRGLHELQKEKPNEGGSQFKPEDGDALEINDT
jgi:hypothetical protein